MLNLPRNKYYQCKCYDIATLFGNMISYKNFLFRSTLPNTVYNMHAEELKIYHFLFKKYFYFTIFQKEDTLTFDTRCVFFFVYI